MTSKKHLILLVAIGFCMPVNGQGFLKGLAKKAGVAAADIIIKKTSKKAEAAIDGIKDNANAETAAVDTILGEKATMPNSPATASSKYDFVPGTTVLFAEDFQQDVVGEFPLKWFTNGSGEVVTLEGKPGKWVKMSSGALISPTFKFPENFTYEFDVFIDLDAKSQSVMPGLSFEIYDRGDKAVKVGYDTYTIKNMLLFHGGMHRTFATFRLDSRHNGQVKLTSEKVTVPNFQQNYHNVVHVAIAVQKERLRLWMNTDKILDLPVAVASPHNFNQFLLWGAKAREGNTAYYFSNFRVAAGTADTRSKLLNEGKFVTNGILFDTNSAIIKKESDGLLKEIAAALMENTAVQFKITGHTDNQGSPDANLVLSKKRAEAVKKSLTETYGVNAAALSTDGKGASQPIADNASAEGKAQNRRVEFIKL
jgi:outer membrane protein OmpA-like peptidoglycan-associated protein